MGVDVVLQLLFRLEARPAYRAPVQPLLAVRLHVFLQQIPLSCFVIAGDASVLLHRLLSRP